MGKDVGQSLGRGQVCRVHRGPQQPQPRLADGLGGGLEDVIGSAQMRGQLDADPGGAHHGRDLIEVLREVLDVGVVAAGGPAQRDRGHRIAARRAAQPQVDAARRGGLQQRELLGDGQWRVVGQHDAAGAQPDVAGLGREVGEQHRRAGGGHRGHVVVFGHPVAGVAQLVGGLRQPHRGGQRIGGGLVATDGNEVEDREPHSSPNAAGPGLLPSWA